MVRRGFERGVARLCPCHDRPHCANELIERRFALGLGGFDQDGPVDDKREVDRHWVVAFINQPLGNVERREAFGQVVI